MIETAENLRREYAISREEQDELALRSHQRAVAAQQDGTFAEEIVPVTVAEPQAGARRRARRAPARRHDARAARRAAADHGPRAIPRRRSRPATPAVRTTARRCASSRIREGRRARAARRSRAWSSWAVAGVAPETMGIGPVPATARALQRAGLTLDDIDLIELNEAFAAQVLAVLREWELPDGLERVNVNGSGISLGHPVGRDRRAHPRDAAARDAPARRRATGWRRCASAAARGWRRSSRISRRRGAVTEHDRDAVRPRAVLRPAPLRRGRRLARRDDRARRGLAQPRRQHQRQPVAAGHRQPARRPTRWRSPSPIRPTARARSCCTPRAAS